MIEYTIPSKNKKHPLELLLGNLRIRLKLQKEWVVRTENEIESVEQQIKELKEKGEL